MYAQPAARAAMWRKRERASGPRRKKESMSEVGEGIREELQASCCVLYLFV